MAVERAAPATPTPTSLGEIARLFLKLGTVAFGGPAAHIAMMEDEVVRRRGWLSRDEFLDYLGATNLIPGPNSTEMAIHIGHARGGWRGLLVAGICFILPATFIVAALAWAYVRFGNLPAAEALLYGVKPVVMAVVAQALVGLGRSAVKSPALALLGAAALAANLFGVSELLLLIVAGVTAAALRTARQGGPAEPRAESPRGAGVTPTGAGGAGLALSTGAAAAGAAMVPVSLWGLFGVFAKVGAVLFGSGYVLLAFLRADLVQRLGWLTERQLLDAVAAGQITPGPVFTTATFVGFVTGGWTGAAVATIGIFLPAFIFVALSGPLVPKLRRSPIAGAVLDGVNVGSLALMAAVTWQLARSALPDAKAVLIGLAALVLLLRYRVNSAWLVVGGGLIGMLA
jgi:chromate transporter